MEQDMIKIIEADLREVVETEFSRFRDKHRDCKFVDSIYLNEDVSVGIHNIPLYGLVCSHHLNLFVTDRALYQFPEFRCYIIYEDGNFRRELAHIMLIYTPVENMCFIKEEIHEYELRETAEHIIKAAAEEEAK
jgi:hypothetical protein